MTPQLFYYGMCKNCSNLQARGEVKTKQIYMEFEMQVKTSVKGVPIMDKVDILMACNKTAVQVQCRYNAVIFF